MPDIAAALAELPVEDALLDGEVVVFDEEGKTSFADLQAAFQEGKKKPLTYVIFDLLHLNGHNLRNLPLEQRKNILEKILAQVSDGDRTGILRYSEHLGTRGGEIFEKACKLGAEGIVSKKAAAPYTSGRSGSWLKIKCVRQQEFVIGGFTPPSKTGVGIGALLLGYYRDGELVYAGRTGTGFTQKARQQMRKRLEEIRQPRPAFSSVPPDGARDAQWVKPKYVCEVKFATWTADNLVRQASFQGLREDKPAKQVTREIPVETASAKRGSQSKSKSTPSLKVGHKKAQRGECLVATPSFQPNGVAYRRSEKEVEQAWQRRQYFSDHAHPSRQAGGHRNQAHQTATGRLFLGGEGTHVAAHCGSAA